jgi:hypothetical protein
VADPNISPLDFFLNVIRDKSFPLDVRITAAREALPHFPLKAARICPASGNAGLIWECLERRQWRLGRPAIDRRQNHHWDIRGTGMRE